MDGGDASRGNSRLNRDLRNRIHQEQHLIFLCRIDSGSGIVPDQGRVAEGFCCGPNGQISDAASTGGC